MRSCWLRSDEAGFTLIELMITLVVLSVGLLALVSLQVNAISLNITSKRQSAAVAVAKSKLEQLKNTPFATVVSESATSVAAAGMTFTRQVTVTANSPQADTQTVLVTVTWVQGARTYTVPLAMVMSRL